MAELLTEKILSVAGAGTIIASRVNFEKKGLIIKG